MAYSPEVFFVREAGEGEGRSFLLIASVIEAAAPGGRSPSPDSNGEGIDVRTEDEGYFVACVDCAAVGGVWRASYFWRREVEACTFSSRCGTL